MQLLSFILNEHNNTLLLDIALGHHNHHKQISNWQMQYNSNATSRKQVAKMEIHTIWMIEFGQASVSILYLLIIGISFQFCCSVQTIEEGTVKTSMQGNFPSLFTSNKTGHSFPLLLRLGSPLALIGEENKFEIFL